MANCALAPLKEIPYLDHPELKFNEHESTQMPFRYVKGEDGKPIMPEVSLLGVASDSTILAHTMTGHG
jgi:ribosome biogenesis SPOUT family RNA methylase Rps3